MKATVPFPRQFGPGDLGYDCRAVKRAVAKELGGPHGMALSTNTYSKPAQANVAKWKGSVGLLNDPIYTIEAHQKLMPSFDEFGASLMNKELTLLTSERLRTAYLNSIQWWLSHRSLLAYDEVRPIPLYLAPYETSEVVHTDCSGFVTLNAKWSGNHDPNGLGFDGEGNTGTLLHACLHISQSSARPTDLIVYRKSTLDWYGHHVVSITSVIGKNEDFNIISNGHPGDTLVYTHSEMLASQAQWGYPLATFLRWIP